MELITNIKLSEATNGLPEVVFQGPSFKTTICLTDGGLAFQSNCLLRALNTGLEIKFINFKQYKQLIEDVNQILSERM